MNKSKTISAINNEKNNTTSFFSNIGFEEKITYGALIVILFWIWVIRGNFLEIPFERDEGSYSYYGKLLLDGKIPYIDFYEQKFPGVFYFYAFIELIFGDTVAQLHRGFNVLNLATIIILFFSAKKLFNPFTAIMVALTYAFTSITPVISGFTIQSEHGVAFWGSLGILFFANYYQEKKWIWLFLMGLAMGAAFMVKTSGIFLALWGGLAVLIDFFFSKEKKWKVLFINLTSYAIGGFLVIGLLFLLVALKGSYNEMLFWTFDVPKYYVSRVSWEEGKKFLLYTKDAIFNFNKFLWVHSLLAFSILFIKNISWKLKLIIISLGIFSFLTIVPGFYFYGHYWLQLLPGLALLSGATFFSITEFFKNQFKFKTSYIVYGYLALFVVMIYTHTNKYKNYYYHPNYEQILRMVYGNNPFPETMEVAKWIKSNSKPEDQVAIIGSEPEFYIYTDKTSPTRHIFFSTIVADLPQHKEWQREFTTDIEKTKPKFILFYNIPISLLVQPNTDKYVFDWANKYISENYNLVGMCDMIQGQRATYIWREQLNGYKPQSQEQIYVYERKN